RTRGPRRDGLLRRDGPVGRPLGRLPGRASQGVPPTGSSGPAAGGTVPAGQRQRDIAWFQRRSYQLADVTCEVAVVAHGGGAGALVYLSGKRNSVPALRLERDFGAVHLDRSFEQNRLRVTPEKRGSTLMTDELKTLAQMATPVVPDLKPSQATLQ